jgi:hypothetical protein
MRLFTVTSVILAFAVLAAAQRGPTTPRTAAPDTGAVPTKAVGSVKDIMVAMTIPTSDDVFKAASEPPADGAGWERVQHQALALAESANLLMMGERSQNRAEWNALARAQLDAAVVAMTAAQRKDADALSNASDALYETCDNCHKQFMPK